ncbi:MAG: hypothetical protein ACFFFK_06895 [Candidatus Thorarchaeota archaeon]
MQEVYLQLTIGMQFFLLMGYLFYLIFRTYGEKEVRVSMLRWLIGLIAFLTIILIVSVALVSKAMPVRDLVVASAALFVDVIGLYLLLDDSQRLSKTFIAEQT